MEFFGFGVNHGHSDVCYKIFILLAQDCQQGAKLSWVGDGGEPFELIRRFLFGGFEDRLEAVRGHKSSSDVIVFQGRLLLLGVVGGFLDEYLCPD